jgi:hypothetical protein
MRNIAIERLGALIFTAAYLLSASCVSFGAMLLVSRLLG